MELELLCVVLWRNWFLRNQTIHGENCNHETDVVPWSRSFLDEFMAAMNGDNESNGGGRVKARWQPPLEGVYKINTDVALDIGN